MSIAIANFPTPVDAGSATSVTTSPTFTSTTGNILIGMGIAAGNAGLDVGSPPFGDGGTNTFTTGHGAGSGLQSGLTASIEWAANITGHANTGVTFTINQTQFPAVGVIEASGIATSSPNTTVPTYTSQASNVSITLNSALITPAAGTYLLVGVILQDTGAAALSVSNAGTGTATWTLEADNTHTNEPIGCCYTIITANGSNTYGFTSNPGDSGKHAAIVGIAAFVQATGGTITVLTPQRTMRMAGI